MAVTAVLVKELNTKTGAGLLDCKKALTESDGDLDQAVDLIRKMGLATAGKKAGRSTKEGLIEAFYADGQAAIVEVLCETDFVSQTDNFKGFVSAVAERTATGDYPEGNIAETVQSTEEQNIGELIASIDENIQIRRAVRWNTTGTVYSYIHDGGGVKMGSLVEVDGDHDADFGKNLAMHIVASAPAYLSPDDVPADLVEKEKEIAKATPDLANKPDDIIEKILIGKINKWYTDVCLTKQKWVHDEKLSVEKAAANATIKRFVRWQVGEDL